MARDERLERLRSGDADVALIDVASLVEAVAGDPDFGAKCVLMVTRRLPMAAHFIPGRPAPERPIEGPEDLVHARYGGEAGSRFVQEHRAALRRLGQDRPELMVQMGYDDLFGGLATGLVDVAPDYAGIATRYRRSARGQRVNVLPYRDCGVQAYGTGIVASGAALKERGEEVGAFLVATIRAYERMREDPAAVIDDASTLLPAIDREYALNEWREEEEAVIFGYDGGLGDPDEGLWRDTVIWRHEVVGLPRLPETGELFQLWM